MTRPTYQPLPTTVHLSYHSGKALLVAATDICAASIIGRTHYGKLPNCTRFLLEPLGAVLAPTESGPNATLEHIDGNHYVMSVRKIAKGEPIFVYRAEMDAIACLKHTLKGLRIGPSNIAGNGMFATKKITTGERVCTSHFLIEDVCKGPAYVRTAAGGFYNHPNKDIEPNCVSRNCKNGQKKELVATMDIFPGDEILCRYTLPEYAGAAFISA